MAFPLAHDDEGLPVEVPPVAVGWLVRRHGGGKGRPGAVYDGEGRPLVVELDATTADLRALGCRPGSYRLDAVDEGRKPLGVTAYTEVATGEEEEGEEGASGADAAVAALARAVEAMQRVQAERERVQALMFQKLIDRIAPGPARPADDLRNTVMQVLDLRKELRKEMEEEWSNANEDGDKEDEDEEDEDEEDDDEEEEEAAPDTNALMNTLIMQATQLLPLLAARFAQPKSAAPAPAAPVAAAPAAAPAVEAAPAVAPVVAPAPAAARAVAPARNAAPAIETELAGVPGAGQARKASGPEAERRRRRLAKAEEFARKAAAVFERLTPEEQEKADALLQGLPKEVIRQIGNRLIALPIEQAVAEARQMLMMTMAAPTNGVSKPEEMP